MDTLPQTPGVSKEALSSNNQLMEIWCAKIESKLKNCPKTIFFFNFEGFSKVSSIWAKFYPKQQSISFVEKNSGFFNNPETPGGASIVI